MAPRLPGAAKAERRPLGRRAPPGVWVNKSVGGGVGWGGVGWGGVGWRGVGGLGWRGVGGVERGEGGGGVGKSLGFKAPGPCFCCSSRLPKRGSTISRDPPVKGLTYRSTRI